MFQDDDVYQDDDDDDYIPPVEKPKTKFKKPKLSDIKVFKGKTVVRTVKLVKKSKDSYDDDDDTGRSRDENKTRSTTITCCMYKNNHSNYTLLYVTINVKLWFLYFRPDNEKWFKRFSYTFKAAERCDCTKGSYWIQNQSAWIV